jgi:hypothetical protein
MTGAYVRIEREGRWQNVEIDTLTDAALEAFAARQGVERGWLWAAALVDWIEAHVTGLPHDERVVLGDIAQACRQHEVPAGEAHATGGMGWVYTRLLVRLIQEHVGQEEGDDAPPM